ncbi:MAG TPA: TonB-dependent siderophore receptor [Gammaproteobacteria bacterium]|nr:TonB-dependent siderophore receptor [Gammaproteobacteria bacterium]
MKRGMAFMLLCCMLEAPLLAAREEGSARGEVYTGTFPEIVVTAIKGILGMSASTGSISEVDRLDSTRSVEVIDRSLLVDSGADRVEDVVSFLPGLLPSSSSAGYSTAFSARGFQSKGDVFLNGHRDNEQFFVRDLATVERIEILKGHGSVLYGSGTPGATLNYISKRPQPQPTTTLGLTVGNNDFIRSTLDSTGPLSRSKRLYYRLVAAGQDGNSSVYDNVVNRHWTIFPSLLWRYSLDGSLRLEAEYSRDNQPYYFGTVYTKGQILYDKSYVLPQARADKRYGRIGLYWQHHFGEDLELRAAINRFTTRRDDRHAGFYYMSGDSLVGYYRLVDDDYEQNSLKVEVVGNLSGFRTTHQLLFGMEYNDDRDEVRSRKNVGGFTLDPFNPDLDIDLAALPLTTNDYVTSNSETGIYLFDRMRLSPEWTLELGTRYSEFDAHIKKMDGSDDSTRTENEAWSNTLGLVWRPREYASYYFNLSESFKPNWGTDSSNNFFKPRETRQIEAGIRYRLAKGRWNIESSIYRLTQKNLLKKDPRDRDYWVRAGERHSQGLELTLQYLPTPGFDMVVTYSYIDAKYVGEESSHRDKTPANIPTHSGSIRLNYAPAEIPSWQFFGGVTAVDKRFGDDANSFEVPGYALLSVGAQYSRRKVRLGFSVANALDERYIAASFADDDIYQGNRRMARLFIEYDS